MPVSHATAAAAPTAPPPLSRLLTRAADLLALGADPATVWSDPGQRLDQRFESRLRLARRSASSGAALAHGVAELAAESRHDAADAAAAAAQRASVLIAGPLGLCYLPAFLCLGIVPVVAGLAGDVLQSGDVMPGRPKVVPRFGRGPQRGGKSMVANMIRLLRARMALLAVDEAGMSTVE